MDSIMNATQFIQAAEDHLLRSRGNAGRNRKEQQNLTTLLRFHTFVLVDTIAGSLTGDLLTAWSALISADIRVYLESLQKVQDSLFQHVEKGESALAFGLGKLHGSKEEDAIYRILDLYRQNTCDECSCFRKMYQFLTFPLRINLSDSQVEIDAFLEVNSRRDGFVPSVSLKDIAREFINENFISEFKRHYRPRHGPGAVSFRSATGLSTRRLSINEKDSRIDGDVVSYYESLMHGESSNVHQDFWDLYTFDDVKVISVPKSWKKQRIIAVEAATSMYVQQGLKHALYRAIARSPFSRFVDFERPEYNGTYAEIGSLYRNFSTIDLKSASDSVGFRFVANLFSETPLWKFIRNARSTHFDVDGLRVESKIFATMGNALCFPIETMVFACIVEEARRWLSSRSPFRVYGDDIVCHSDITEALQILLEKYGFEVNADKTFTTYHCPFRESCGYEFYDGEDVSPLRISRNFAGLPCVGDYEQIQALISLANSSYRVSKRLYRFIVDHINGLGYAIPFSLDGSIGFITDNPDNIPWCWNHDLQVRGIKGIVPMPVVRHARRKSIYAYAENLLLIKDRQAAIEEAVVTSCTSSVRGFRKLEHNYYVPPPEL